MGRTAATASRPQNRRRSRRASPSRAAVSGVRPAIAVETATSPRRRSTGARSPARIARAAAMRSGAVPAIPRRTRRLPVNNLLQGRPRDPRNHNRRTPKLSMEEWSCPTACPAEGARGTSRRAARPALVLLMGASVLTKTASTGSGRTAAGIVKMKGRATSSKWTTRASRRPSPLQNLHQSPRRAS